jgi:glutamate-ammonia-ligase adenylyltransferase
VCALEISCDQIAAFPLLLDELLDDRLFETAPTAATSKPNCAAAWKMHRGGSGTTSRGVATVPARSDVPRRSTRPDGPLPLMKVSDRLTDIAEIIVQQALDLAWQQITHVTGVPLSGSSPDRADRRA